MLIFLLEIKQVVFFIIYKTFVGNSCFFLSSTVFYLGKLCKYRAQQLDLFSYLQFLVYFLLFYACFCPYRLDVETLFHISSSKVGRF